MKKKKLMTFETNQPLVINTTHCKGEYSLIKNVINSNNWKETNSLGKGHIFWYGNSLSESDKLLMNNRSCWYNRYVGGGYLSYKRTFSQLLNIALKIFPKEYEYFCPKTFFLPEDKELIEQELVQKKS